MKLDFGDFREVRIKFLLGNDTKDLENTVNKWLEKWEAEMNLISIRYVENYNYDDGKQCVCIVYEPCKRLSFA